MTTTQLNIIQTLTYLSSKSTKQYTLASQPKILGLLRRYYSKNICRRALNYALRSLEDGGYIRRIKRHKAGPDGNIIFATTISIVKMKGHKALGRVARFFRSIGWKIKRNKTLARDDKQTNFQASMILRSQRQFDRAHPPNRIR